MIPSEKVFNSLRGLGDDPVILSCSVGLCGLLFLLLLLRASKRKRPAKSQHRGCAVVLVTGCDSGFGKLLVAKLIDDGFVVVCACLTDAGKAALPAGAVGFDGDLTDSSKLKSLVSLTESTVEAGEGRYLHAVINNAGVCMPGNVLWTHPDSYRKTMDINFFVPVHLTYSLLPLLKQSKGRVVNVSSIDGFLSLPANAAYNCSKSAIEAYSDTLRCEMIPFGVKVILIGE